jgi:hypothetical protein
MPPAGFLAQFPLTASSLRGIAGQRRCDSSIASPVGLVEMLFFGLPGILRGKGRFCSAALTALACAETGDG